MFQLTRRQSAPLGRRSPSKRIIENCFRACASLMGGAIALLQAFLVGVACCVAGCLDGGGGGSGSTPTPPPTRVDAGLDALLDEALCQAGYQIVGRAGEDNVSIAFSLAGTTDSYDPVYSDLIFETVEKVEPAPGQFEVRTLGGVHSSASGFQLELAPNGYVAVVGAIEDQAAVARIVSEGGVGGGPWQFVTPFQSGAGWFHVALPVGADGRRVILGTCHTDYGDSKVDIVEEPTDLRWRARWTFRLDRVRRVIVSDLTDAERNDLEGLLPERWSQALCDAPVLAGSLVGCGHTFSAQEYLEPSNGGGF